VFFALNNYSLLLCDCFFLFHSVSVIFPSFSRIFDSLNSAFVAVSCFRLCPLAEVEIAVKIWLTVGPLGCLCDGARGEDLAVSGTTGWDVSVMEIAVTIWLTAGPLGCLCDGACGEDLAVGDTIEMSL